MPSADSFSRPTGDELIAGALVVGSVLLLIALGRVFRDVAPA